MKKTVPFMLVVIWLAILIANYEVIPKLESSNPMVPYVTCSLAYATLLYAILYFITYLARLVKNDLKKQKNGGK